MSPPEHLEESARPEGPEQVRAALVEAAIRLILDEGPKVSVRRIAMSAGVNHGLVHAYFGSKHGLIVAALDEINRRAAAEIGPEGYPPPDLAQRRSGELARSMARLSLDEGQDLFSSHPVLGAWRAAIERDRPDLDASEVEDAIVMAASLALGWAVFSDHLCSGLGITDRARVERVIAAETSRLGLLPAER